MKEAQPIIALLTDFGESDFFVPSMKGVIASINSTAKVVDITHSIPSFDVLAGGFVLFASYRFFPKKTIFVSIIDPGVGSSRKILLAQSEKYSFIAPDNGLLSPVLEEEGFYELRDISNPKYYLDSTGVTFEGRDKMAPVSAWLSLGIHPEEFGPKIEHMQKMDWDSPQQAENEIKGAILYSDKFGNLITNISSSMLEPLVKKYGKKALCLMAGDARIPFGEFYSAVPKNEPVFVLGSVGLIEVSVNGGSALNKLNLKPGDKVRITRSKTT